MPQRERTKASNACLACRRSKRRCNGALPACSNCVRSGKICHYRPESDGRKHISGAYVESLEQQLKDLTDVLEGVRSHHRAEAESSAQNSDVVPDPKPSTRREKRVFGRVQGVNDGSKHETFAVFEVDRGSTPINDPAKLSAFPNGLGEKLGSSARHHQDTRLFEHIPSSVLHDSRLCPWVWLKPGSDTFKDDVPVTQVKSSIEITFEPENDSIPLGWGVGKETGCLESINNDEDLMQLFESNFESEFGKLHLLGDESFHGLGLSPTEFLSSAACALGAQCSTSDTVQNVGRIFQERAERAVMFLCRTKNDPRVYQGALILSYLHLFVGNRKMSQIYYDVSCILRRDLRSGRDAPFEKSETRTSDFDIDGILSRVYHVHELLGFTISAVTGGRVEQGEHLDEHGVTHGPAAEEDIVAKLSILEIQVWRLTQREMERIDRAHASPSVELDKLLLELHAKMVKLDKEIPRTAPSREQNQTAALINARMATHMAYITLHSRLLSLPTSPKSTELALRICSESAFQIARLWFRHKQILEKSSVPIQIVHYVYCAAVILLMNTSSIDPDMKAKAKQAFNVVHDALSTMAKGIPLARMATNMILRIADDWGLSNAVLRPSRHQSVIRATELPSRTRTTTDKPDDEKGESFASSNLNPPADGMQSNQGEFTSETYPFPPQYVVPEPFQQDIHELNDQIFDNFQQNDPHPMQMDPVEHEHTNVSLDPFDPQNTFSFNFPSTQPTPQPSLYFPSEHQDQFSIADQHPILQPDTNLLIPNRSPMPQGIPTSSSAILPPFPSDATLPLTHYPFPQQNHDAFNLNHMWPAHINQPDNSFWNSNNNNNSMSLSLGSLPEFETYMVEGFGPNDTEPEF